MSAAVGYADCWTGAVLKTVRETLKRWHTGAARRRYVRQLQRNTAELIRTAFSSVRLVITSFLTPLVKMTSDLMVSTGFLIVLVLAAPWATALAFLILGPTLYVVLRWVRPKLHRLGRRSETETAAALQTLQHSLHGIREIKVTQTNDYFTEVFHRTASRLERIQYRVALLNRSPTVLVETLVVLFIVTLLLATTVGPFAGEESVAVLGLFAYAALRMMPILNRTAQNVNKIRFGSGAVESVRRDLELVQLDAPAFPQHPPPFVFESAIELRDVSFTYENATTPALRNVDLVVKRGERLGIAGQTGAGKSTILDLILGLLSPPSGDALVAGDPLDTHMPGWLAGIGMVPQSVFLIDDTIRRNVAFGVSGPTIDDERVEEALKLAQLSTFVSSLPDGAETVVGERGVRLSGGQRQRIAIARALYGDPPILILDEGTSALDSSTESELMEALESASRDRTVIVVAHRLSTVRRADRIVLLDDGEIVDIGTFDELVARNASFRELAQ